MGEKEHVAESLQSDQSHRSRRRTKSQRPKDHPLLGKEIQKDEVIERAGIMMKMLRLSNLSYCTPQTIVRSSLLTQKEREEAENWMKAFEFAARNEVDIEAQAVIIYDAKRNGRVIW